MTLEVAIGCDSTENLSYFMYCSWQYGLQNSLSCALDIGTLIRLYSYPMAV